MDRTLRAALLAAFIAFAFITGIGIFLQFEVAASLIVGVVAGALAGLLIWGAARRADSFHDEPRPPIEPGFPGPPEHPDDPSDEDDDR